MKTIGGSTPGLGSHVAALAELGIAALATDCDGVVRECNRAAAELYGRPEREMLDVSLSTIRLAQADEAIAESILRGLLEVGRWRGEVEIEDAAGLTLRLDVRARVILDSDARPVGFEAVFDDLSGRVQAEQRAVILELRLGVAQRLAGLGSWKWDPRTDRLTASDGFRSLLGVASGSQLTMADALAAMPVDDQVRVRCAIDEMRSTGSDSCSVEYRVRGSDGELHSLAAQCGAVRGRDGTLTGIRGTTRDMTERIRARDRLQQAEEFWQGTLDSFAAHIAVLDEHGAIIAVNAAWRRFAQTENGGSDYIGSNYVTVCEASSDPVGKAVARELREVLAGDRELFELEYPCHRPTVQRWFLLRATRYKGPGPRRVVVAHEDITDRRQALEQASMQAVLLDEMDVS